MIKTAFVKIWNETVGAVAWDEQTQMASFEFDNKFISKQWDICHAYRPNSEWVSQHALSVNGKRQGITTDDLLTVAKSMNIKKAASIIVEIKETVAKWNQYAEETKVDEKLRDAISSTL